MGSFHVSFPPPLIIGEICSEVREGNDEAPKNINKGLVCWVSRERTKDMPHGRYENKRE